MNILTKRTFITFTVVKEIKTKCYYNDVTGLFDATLGTASKFLTKRGALERVESHGKLTESIAVICEKLYFISKELGDIRKPEWDIVQV
jgi:hypothetical protein